MNLKKHVNEFEKLIVWKLVAGPGKVEIPEPQSGIDEIFDEANQKIENLKKELQDYLGNIQKQFKDSRRI